MSWGTRKVCSIWRYVSPFTVASSKKERGKNEGCGKGASDCNAWRVQRTCDMRVGIGWRPDNPMSSENVTVDGKMGLITPQDRDFRDFWQKLVCKVQSLLKISLSVLETGVNDKDASVNKKSGSCGLSSEAWRRHQQLCRWTIFLKNCCSGEFGQPHSHVRCFLSLQVVCRSLEGLSH